MSLFSAARVRFARSAIFASGALVIAGCTVAPPPLLNTTVAATPPLIAVPPLRPAPPFGASIYTQVPGSDGLGGRQTINTGITSTEVLWNLRSAWNVAALNCSGARYTAIIEGYRELLNANEDVLASANSALDEQFRETFGGNYRRTRDTHSTRVYNYFALPPARTYFCEATLATAQRYRAAPPADLMAFAQVELAQIERAFDRFYGDFERYQTDRVAWEGTFGPQYGGVYRPDAAPQPQAEGPPVGRSGEVVQDIPVESQSTQ